MGWAQGLLPVLEEAGSRPGGQKAEQVRRT